MFKYGKAFAGADPTLMEDDLFHSEFSLESTIFNDIGISGATINDAIRAPENETINETIKNSPGISLKKLEEIRFPFQKPSIGGEKPSIDELLARLRLTQPTRENIKKLASTLKDGEIFGRSRIMEIVGLSNGPAGDMINTMLRNGLLDSVRGHGKGKYRFRI